MLSRKWIGAIVVGTAVTGTGAGLLAWWKLKKGPDPFVSLDYGSFRGKLSADSKIEQFYGIPFGEPPVGQLRFANPIPPRGQFWNHDSTDHAPGCPQQTIRGNVTSYEAFLNNLGWNPLQYLKPYGPGQEDCLTLDITRPAGLNKNSKLPVMYFIYPGGFNYGVSWMLTGKPMVKRSMEIGLPVIWVSGNHRVNAFGFLGGREVGKAGVGNLGLKDQRLTMEWIQKHISEFGGDPTKVTVYGESSGAISISHHLLAFDGNLNGLFRAAICQSGTALPVGKLSDGEGQKGFDNLVTQLGCLNSTDKLDCLRSVDLRTMQRVIDQYSFQTFPLTFGPAVDGVFVTNSIQDALASGKFAKISLISGDVQDEGTMMAKGRSASTKEELRADLSRMVPKARPEQIENVLQLWPSDPKLGSPFGSGDKNTITPVYKQYAAILGDFGFQGLRRLFHRSTSGVMPTWSYIDRAAQNVPFVGAFHVSDLPAVVGLIPGSLSDEYQARWISFAHNLNPNFPGLPNWETYGTGKSLGIDKKGSTGMEPDDFRQQAIDYYISNIESFTFATGA